MGCHQSKLQGAALQQAEAEVVRQVLVASGAPTDGLPDLEQLRLKALQDCRVLDTPAEARFDNITKLLQGIFKTPMALVSLIDHDRLVFHSQAGPTGAGGRRVHSFWVESLKARNPTMMVVEDTLQDARFQRSQFVEGPPHVCFYAGAPLVSSEGYIYGSLGILDLVPRRFPADQLTMICNFAELVVREMERDKMVELQNQRATALAGQQRCLVRAVSCFSEAIILCDLTTPNHWRILYANDAWEKLTALLLRATVESPFWELLQLPDPEAIVEDEMGRMHTAITQRAPFTARFVAKRGAQSALQLSFRPATGDHIGDRVPLIGIPSFVEATGGAGYGDAHYFAIVESCKLSHRSPRGILSRHSSLDRTSSTSTGGGSGMLGSAGDGASTHSAFGLDRPQALAELKLGPMLGKGSYGKVYRGLWRGAVVAVKVLDAWTPCPIDGAPASLKGPMLEALLSRELSHPHIVQTFEYASRSEQVELHSSREIWQDYHVGDDEQGVPIDEVEGSPTTAVTPRKLQRVRIIP